MAYEENLHCRTLEADASLGIYTGPPGAPGSLSPNSGKQYRAVKITGPDTCGLCGANDGAFTGILQNKPQNVGDAATVADAGVSKVECGGTFAAGNSITTDATGRSVLATTGQKAYGRAQLPGAIGTLSSVFIDHHIAP